MIYLIFIYLPDIEILTLTSVMDKILKSLTQQMSSELELGQHGTWRDSFADVARESFNSFKDFSDIE